MMPNKIFGYDNGNQMVWYFENRWEKATTKTKCVVSLVLYQWTNGTCTSIICIWLWTQHEIKWKSMDGVASISMNNCLYVSFVFKYFGTMIETIPWNGTNCEWLKCFAGISVCPLASYIHTLLELNWLQIEYLLHIFATLMKKKKLIKM